MAVETFETTKLAQDSDTVLNLIGQLHAICGEIGEIHYRDFDRSLEHWARTSFLMILQETVHMLNGRTQSELH